MGSKRPPDPLLPAPPCKDEGCLGHIPKGETALPSPDPRPLATFQRAGGDLSGDFCQVFCRPGEVWSLVSGVALIA